jgi:O-antigen/teichoic acid export membrane protein
MWRAMTVQFSNNSAMPEISKASVGRGAIWSMLANGGAQGISLLTFLVTARFVSKESFGIIATSIAVVELLKRIGIEPFALAVATKSDVRNVDYNACFFLTSGVSLIFSVGLMVSAKLVAGLVNRPEIVDALQAISLLLLTIGLSRTHEAWLARNMQFKALAIRSIVAGLFGGAVGVSMAVAGFQLWSLVGQQLVTSLTSLALLWANCGWRPRLVTTRAALAANARAASHLIGSALGGFFSTETDIFVASAFLGVRTAGIYNAAKRIMLAVNVFLNSSLQNVTLAAFANTSGAEMRRSMMLRSSGVVAAITMPAAVGISVLAPDILLFLLGGGWVDAAPVLSALALGVVIVSINQFGVTVFLTHGRTGLNTRYVLLNAALNLITLPMVVRYGAGALAVTVTAIQAAVLPLTAGKALQILGLSHREYFETLAKPFFAAAAMGAVVYGARYALPFTGLQALLVLIPAGVLCYLAALWLISRSLIHELVGLGLAIIGRDATVLS